MIYLNTQTLIKTAENNDVMCWACGEILPKNDIKIDKHMNRLNGNIIATVWAWCDCCGESGEILTAWEENGKWRIEIQDDPIC